jgi:hypothetical protein
MSGLAMGRSFLICRKAQARRMDYVFQNDGFASHTKLANKMVTK